MVHIQLSCCTVISSTKYWYFWREKYLLVCYSRFHHSHWHWMLVILLSVPSAMSFTCFFFHFENEFVTCSPSLRHRHFIRLFRETAPFSRLLRTLGIRRTISRLNPRIPMGAQIRYMHRRTYGYACMVNIFTAFCIFVNLPFNHSPQCC